MEVIEQFIQGKYNDLELCEDAILVTDNYIVVIDGATSKGNLSFGDLKSGQAITKSILNYFRNQTQNLTGQKLIQSISNHIKENLLIPYGQTVKTKNTPSAALGVYSKINKSITIVGDITVKINETIHYNRSKFDEAMALSRSIAYELFQKPEIPDEIKSDKGRDYILPILKNQHNFRNMKENSNWSYGNIDGYEVPSNFINTFLVESNQVVILSTDGYPKLYDSLKESEKNLKSIIAKDPMLVNIVKSTKGVYKNQISFDDRAYIKFIT